jgi:two-component system, LuxR family, response regulator FixJ
MSPLKILVVDDNEEFRETLGWWIEGMGYTVSLFSDPVRFLEFLKSNKPNATDTCVLLDVRMPNLSGVQLHLQMIANELTLPVIYMTGHGDIPMAVDAMQRGAVSFLEKPFREEALEHALKLAQQLAKTANMPSNTIQGIGPNGLSSIVDDKASSERELRTTEWQRRQASLTPRETDVYKLVIQGRLNKLIADALGISIKTVELHRSRVMQKLKADSITSLIRMHERGMAD